MKKSLSLTILLTCGLAWASAQEATTLQVAPSDQVIYPDASQILNKTEPKAAAKPAAKPLPPAAAPAQKLPSAKPLVTSLPVPAKAAGVPRAPVQAPAPGTVPPDGQGWYLRWTIPGDEAAARAWAQALGREVRVEPAGQGLWMVLEGPLAPGTLDKALGGQAGVASLVRL